MPRKPKPTGLAEVTPPAPSNGRAPTFPPEQVAAVAAQVKNGKWLSDLKDYASRGSANWKAEAMIRELAKLGVTGVKRKTWAEGKKFRWAIQRQKGAS